MPGSPVNAPIGTCRGSAHPGRVSWSYRPDACTWDGETGSWWEDQYVNRTTVESMFASTLMSITDASSVNDAWDNLFTDFNKRVHNEARGYKAGDKLAIKVNLNGMFGSYDSNEANGLSPQYLKALLKSLVSEYGIPQDEISVYDASRWFIDFLYDPPQGVHDDFPNVHYVDNQGLNGREQVQVDYNSHLQYSSTDVPGWNVTYLPTCATSARYMIVVDNFRGHVLAGVTITGKNFFGSIYRPDCDCGASGSWCPMSLHDFVDANNRQMGSFTPFVDFLSHPDLAAKAVVFLTDGLYAGFDQDPHPPVRFYSSPFNGGWTCSVFASQDPVAMDSVAYDFLRNEPNVPDAHSGCIDNYMHEAALANNPPSGTTYNPTGTSPVTTSLGCHEHWDSAATKRYSRNLNPTNGKGIELYSL
eukprot:TRINITY_DN1412_c0_g3_i1.p1 TRINITY_DN1412_c0_g3~~TRINITY_DN1412_c0_g3_i1.p1  ORF type:complete len:448 (+),score=83.80 TRINITY_DN1412_c0_g3_i1:99-1346(+)